MSLDLCFTTSEAFGNNNPAVSTWFFLSFVQSHPIPLLPPLLNFYASPVAIRVFCQYGNLMNKLHFTKSEISKFKLNKPDPGNSLLPNRFLGGVVTHFREWELIWGESELIWGSGNSFGGVSFNLYSDCLTARPTNRVVKHVLTYQTIKWPTDWSTN